MTPAQLTTLKTYIANNADLNVKPMSEDGNFAIASLLNITAVPDFIVWRTEAPTDDIFDAITWANYTPTDAVTDAVLADTLVCARQQTRLLAIQTKQINVNNMLGGRPTVNAGKANVRAGLRDAVINLPSGANGALVSAGGANAVTVLNKLTRKAKRGEQVFTTGAAQTGGVTADVMGYEGDISQADVKAARELP